MIATPFAKPQGRATRPTDIPTVTIPADQLKDGCLPAAVLLKTVGLTPSSSEARRLIQGGGAYFGDDLQTMSAHDQPIRILDGLLIKVGKKKLVRISVGRS